MIRIATLDDAAEIRRIYAPAVCEGVTSFETVVPTENELRQRVSSTREQYPWLVDADEQRLRGFAYATSHRARTAYRWSVEVSVYVDSLCLRRGCGRELYLRLFEILVEQGFYSAYAGIAVPNVASQVFHESLGFTRIGVFPRVGYKHGAWRDVGWWYLQLQDTDSDPQPPVTFADWQASHPGFS